MRKFLNRIDTPALAALGRDYSIYGDRAQIIQALIEYFAGYRITVSDLLSRYPHLRMFSL